MKCIFLVLFLWLIATPAAFCQDSIIVQSGPCIKRRVHFTLVINNLLITDTAKAALILENFSEVIVKRKAVSPSKALEKWGIHCKDFVLFCRTKKGVILNLDEMKSLPEN